MKLVGQVYGWNMKQLHHLITACLKWAFKFKISEPNP